MEFMGFLICYFDLCGFWFSEHAEIMAATSMVRPRADVAYCIHALHRRLIKTRNWTVRLQFIFRM